MTFHVGQVVECVDVEGNIYVAIGKRYVVAGFFMMPSGSPAIFIEGPAQRAHDLSRGGKPTPFYARRFRPIVEKKTDIGFAHEILRKVSRKQTERA